MAGFSIMNSLKKLTRELLVSNRCGIHARVAMLLAKKANEFTSKISIHKGNYTADCRSVLDLLSLGAFQGEAIILEADGHDAEDAIGAITALFNARFFEDEVE